MEAAKQWEKEILSVFMYFFHVIQNHALKTADGMVYQFENVEMVWRTITAKIIAAS